MTAAVHRSLSCEQEVVEQLVELQRRAAEFCSAMEHWLVLHYDLSHAVEPLDRTSEWDDAESPETFPSGL